MSDPSAPTIPLGSEPTRPLGGASADARRSFAIYQGLMLLGRYRAMERIGRGGQAEVWRCTQDEDPRTVAIKFCPSDFGRSVRDDVLGTIRDFHGSKHQDILRVLDIQHRPEGLYEIQEYAEGGDLTAGGHHWTEAELTKLLKEMHNSLITLHSAGIIHRDVKPTNFLFRDAKRTDLVLGDFGIASALQGDSGQILTEARCTTIYSAPELAVSMPGIRQVVLDHASDYFSLGMTVVALLAGEEFLSCYSAPALHRLKTNAKVPMPEGLSGGFRRLLQGLLHPQSDLRWGRGEVARWLNGEDVPVAAFTSDTFEYRLSSQLIAHTREELGAHLYANPILGREHLSEGTLLRTLDRSHQDLATEMRRIQRLVPSPDAQVLALAYTLNPELPFRFSAAQEISKSSDFIRLADSSAENWDLGRQHLFGGALLWWLKNTPAGAAIIEEWNRCKEGYRQEANQNEGLEHFLHLVDPKLPWPEVAIDPQSLGRMEFAEASPQSVQIRVLRRGRGYLSGTLELLEPRHEMTLSEVVFRGPETVITLVVPLQNAAPGDRQMTNLRIRWNKPQGELDVPVGVAVVVPWGRVHTTAASFAASGALLCGGIRWLLPEAGVIPRGQWLFDAPVGVREVFTSLERFGALLWVSNGAVLHPAFRQTYALIWGLVAVFLAPILLWRRVRFGAWAGTYTTIAVLFGLAIGLGQLLFAVVESGLYYPSITPILPWATFGATSYAGFGYLRAGGRLARALQVRTLGAALVLGALTFVVVRSSEPGRPVIFDRNTEVVAGREKIIPVTPKSAAVVVLEGKNTPSATWVDFQPCFEAHMGGTWSAPDDALVLAPDNNIFPRAVNFRTGKRYLRFMGISGARVVATCRGQDPPPRRTTTTPPPAVRPPSPAASSVSKAETQSAKPTESVQPIIESAERKIAGGDYDGALADAERATQVAPRDQKARALLERVRRIRSVLR